MKVVICFVLVFTASFFSFYFSPVARSTEKENHCFTCHTNARKLIKITREIAKANKDKPGGSAETEGEG
ncbi:hypothetical protein KAR26_04340 [Candidatus Parcubacteria bacterium]|nr:hypothetical protein [Candidatus Parcubacteria bacterium]